MVRGSMKQKTRILLAWLFAAFCLAAGSIQVMTWLVQLSAPPASELVNVLVWELALPVVFVGLGALIISRQPGNRVGWLLMGPALPTVVGAVLPGSPPHAPESLTLGLWLRVWFDGWSWTAVFFPIFLIPLHFPTGYPPSPRWRWVTGLAGGMWLFFLVFSAFVDQITPLSGEWSLPNPIGFIPFTAELEGAFLIVWSIALVTVLSFSFASLWVRYRRAQAGERQQIKWLLYAAALFTVVYSVSVISASSNPSSPVSVLADLAFVLSILAIPVAIAVAILRYRLYDIDIIIRRTLVYSLVTALLAVVYLGGVTVMQTLFTAATGQTSPLSVVLSTLAIAALFSPLRRRIQDFIDQRFYRKKYNAEQALASFAAEASAETDLEQLTRQVVEMVGSTLQPVSAGLWLISKISDGKGIFTRFS
jgi:hypothetical protein